MPSERNTPHLTDPVEVWKDWNETTTKVWMKTPDNGKKTYRDPFDLYSLWMEPFMCFNPWNAPGRIWTQMVGAMMSSEQLLDAHYQFIDVSINIIRWTSQLVNEAMFPNRRLPAHPDVAQVAKLVSSLEERVYAIEDALVDFEDGNVKVAPAQIVEKLAGHLEGIDGKQDTSNTLVSILQQTEVIEDLAKRLERMEGKMDILLAALAKIEANRYPEALSPGGEG